VGEVKGFWSVVSKRPEVELSEKWEMKCNEIRWSEEMILGEMCLLALVYIYLALCMFYAVRCVVIGFYLLSFNYSTYFLILSLVFSLCSVLVFYWVFVSFRVFFPHFVYSCLFPIFAQGYRPLGAWCVVVVNSLHYYTDGPGIYSRCCHWIFQWHISFQPYHGPGVDSAPSENENIPGGKGGRCVRLTTSTPSRAECNETWEPKPPGTLWASPGLLRDSFSAYTDHCHRVDTQLQAINIIS
jgi:hypothetical protein